MAFSFRCLCAAGIFVFIIEKAPISGKVKNHSTASPNLLFFTNPAVRLFLPPCVFMQF